LIADVGAMACHAGTTFQADARGDCSNKSVGHGANAVRTSAFFVGHVSSKKFAHSIKASMRELENAYSKILEEGKGKIRAMVDRVM